MNIMDANSGRGTGRSSSLLLWALLAFAVGGAWANWDQVGPEIARVLRCFTVQ